MNTRNTPIAATAVCLSFNYCAPTQSFAGSTMERVHNTLPTRRNHAKRKQSKTPPAKPMD